MENINNIQLKEVARDFLLTPNPTRPLVIWGKTCTGKTEIIDNVVAEMKFYKLLKDEERYVNCNSNKVPQILKRLNITLDLFSDPNEEIKTELTEIRLYAEIFSCCRIINTNDSQNPHIILEAKYTDERQEQNIVQTINDKCNALAYLYVLTIEDWAEWAGKTGKVNPYFIAFLKEHPEKFNYLDKTIPYSFPVTPYNWVQTTSEMLKAMEYDTINPKSIGSKTLYQILYKSVLFHAHNAAPIFKKWLEEKFDVKIEEDD